MSAMCTQRYLSLRMRPSELAHDVIVAIGTSPALVRLEGLLESR